MSVDASAFRSALGRFASGVVVVTAVDDQGRDHGMTVTAFCSVSLAPPRVLVCIGHDASLFDTLAGTERFGVNILAADQEALSRRFAEPESDRFDGVGYTRSESGVALLDGALTHLECRVVSRYVSGDHTVMVGEVERAEVRPPERTSGGASGPLLYYRGGYAQLDR